MAAGKANRERIFLAQFLGDFYDQVDFLARAQEERNADGKLVPRAYEYKIPDFPVFAIIGGVKTNIRHGLGEILGNLKRHPALVDLNQDQWEIIALAYEQVIRVVDMRYATQKRPFDAIGFYRGLGLAIEAKVHKGHGAVNVGILNDDQIAALQAVARTQAVALVLLFVEYDLLDEPSHLERSFIRPGKKVLQCFAYTIQSWTALCNQAEAEGRKSIKLHTLRTCDKGVIIRRGKLPNGQVCADGTKTAWLLSGLLDALDEYITAYIGK